MFSFQLRRREKKKNICTTQDLNLEPPDPQSGALSNYASCACVLFSVCFLYRLKDQQLQLQQLMTSVSVLVRLEILYSLDLSYYKFQFIPHVPFYLQHVCDFFITHVMIHMCIHLPDKIVSLYCQLCCNNQYNNIIQQN
ncbi:Hypothetical_protein [Hexamita inflata]|uniref:Hypothetical_protein n=1 Tax=Hexamita inflata TaxID=28002 RepID=A0ABP1HXS4_9EUKA